MKNEQQMISVPIPDYSTVTRKAIVISNCYSGSNQLTPLPSGKPDFFLANSTLEKFGFSVTCVFDGDLNHVSNQVRSFVNSLNDGDVSLFYFSGHGEQVNHSNILYANDGGKFQLHDNYISQIAQKRGMHMVVLDCCRTQGKGNGTIFSYLTY